MEPEVKKGTKIFCFDCGSLVCETVRDLYEQMIILPFHFKYYQRIPEKFEYCVCELCGGDYIRQEREG